MFDFYLKKCFALLFGIIIFIMIAACSSVNNNSLNTRDLATCLTAHGVKIEYISPLQEAVLYADSAMEMGISGKRVAAYYFNTDLEVQRNRLAKIKENKYVYIMGLKFPAIVYGSYVLVNVNANPQKHKIIAGLKNFYIR
ncbi:MAG: hypothetical protein KOO69_08405 [Victivallales bacterium]|nr:hypothetical protein [Victivallales bacterium]